MRLWKKISCSRLEPWDVEIKISLSSWTLRCWEQISSSSRTLRLKDTESWNVKCQHFIYWSCLQGSGRPSSQLGRLMRRMMAPTTTLGTISKIMIVLSVWNHAQSKQVKVKVTSRNFYSSSNLSKFRFLLQKCELRSPVFFTRRWFTPTMGSSSASLTPSVECGKLVDRQPWPPPLREVCWRQIWTSSWAHQLLPALVHLLLTFSDRLLGLHPLPLLLHQATLELGVVAIAAAVATEGQQQRHAQMLELQHTRPPW